MLIYDMHKGIFFPVLNHLMWGSKEWREGSMHFLELGVRCKGIISVMLWPLYPEEGVSVPQLTEIEILYIKALWYTLE
jgi:hypothetical protein